METNKKFSVFITAMCLAILSVIYYFILSIPEYNTFLYNSALKVVNINIDIYYMVCCLIACGFLIYAFRAASHVNINFLDKETLVSSCPYIVVAFFVAFFWTLISPTLALLTPLFGAFWGGFYERIQKLHEKKRGLEVKRLGGPFLGFTSLLVGLYTGLLTGLFGGLYSLDLRIILTFFICIIILTACIYFSIYTKAGRKFFGFEN